MIELKNISRTYKNSSGDFIAIKNVSYKFNNNGMYGLIGPSGAGKSTILGIIGLIDSPTSGEIYINNNLVTKANYVQLRKEYFSFIFQENNLIDNYSVIDNLHLISNDDNKINALLEKLKLSDTKNAFISELSGGEIQRIAFIRVILENKPVLLCDEPTGSLDIANRKLLMELLKEVSNEKLVIIVSHDQEQTKTFADEIIEINDHSLRKINGNIKEKEYKESIITNKKINSSIIIKNELKYKPINNILHFFLFLIIGILISLSANAIYYNEREGAKYNSVKGDVIEVYKEISYNHQTFTPSDGKTLNDSIRNQIPASNRKEAFFSSDIAFVYDDDKGLKENEIILTNNYSYYEGSNKITFQIGDTVSIDSDINYIVKSFTSDCCNYINSSSKIKLTKLKRKYIEFTLPTENNVDTIELSNNGSYHGISTFKNSKYLRPSSDINLILNRNEVIYSNNYGSNYHIPNLKQVENWKYLTDSYINLADYCGEQINVLNISISFPNQNPNMNAYDKNCFYVNSEVYQEIQNNIDEMDLNQYVIYNDKDKVIDFIYDNDLQVNYNIYKDKSSNRLSYYILNSGADSGLHALTVIQVALYIVMNAVLIFSAAYLMRNKVRTRKNIIGLLDLKGVKRLISTTLVNIDTILILIADSLVCIGLCFSEGVSSLINSFLTNTGMPMDYFYPSFTRAIVLGVSTLFIIALSILFGAILLRKTTTKEIFKIKE